MCIFSFATFLFSLQYYDITFFSCANVQYVGRVVVHVDLVNKSETNQRNNRKRKHSLILCKLSSGTPSTKTTFSTPDTQQVFSTTNTQKHIQYPRYSTDIQYYKYSTDIQYSRYSTDFQYLTYIPTDDQYSTYIPPIHL